MLGTSSASAVKRSTMLRTSASISMSSAKSDFILGNARHARFEIRRCLDELVNSDALQALNQQADRTVRRAEQTVDGSQVYRLDCT